MGPSRSKLGKNQHLLRSTKEHLLGEVEKFWWDRQHRLNVTEVVNRADIKLMDIRE